MNNGVKHEILKDFEITVSQIMSEFEVSQPTVYEWLKGTNTKLAKYLTYRLCEKYRIDPSVVRSKYNVV